MEPEEFDPLVQRLIEGDQAAYAEFHARYGRRLFAIAEKQISENLKARFDANDIVQSMFRTFFRRATEGHFEIEDSRKLWSLICAITLTKVREKARFHLRQSRSVQDEVHGNAQPDGVAIFGSTPGELTPGEKAEFADEFMRFVESLEDEEKSIVDMKLQDRSNSEIADTLGVSERTVTRLSGRLEQKLRRTFQGESS